MSTLGKMILATILEGTTARGHMAALAQATGVSRSPDWCRIDALPRRDWHLGAEQAARIATSVLRTDTGTMALWPEQGAALQDLATCGGLVAPLAVGRGKALISILAASVVACERPLLMVPASLREQTVAHVLPEMRRHWRIHENLQVAAYSELSQAKHATALEDYQPDLLILDECHYLAHPTTAARTKRVMRWLRAARAVLGRDCLVVALSGTIHRKSLTAWAHLAVAALGMGAPVPHKWHTTREWSEALDLDIPADRRTKPGALALWARDGESVEEAVGRRITETPGIVASGADQLGTSLVISELPVAVPDSVRAALRALDATWITPAGDYLIDSLSYYRTAREISLGYELHWIEPAPREWLEARKAWANEAREIIRAGKADTELTAARYAAARGSSTLAEWHRIKSRFVPRVAMHPIDRYITGVVAQWARESPGLIWVDSPWLGASLATDTGLPYYPAGDDRVLTARPETTGACIVSLAHSEGKNLQAYSANLVLAPMSSGKAWEQLLGRTHRHGQMADTVTCDVCLHTAPLRESLEAARREAAYVEHTLGARQKLCYATYTETTRP